MAPLDSETAKDLFAKYRKQRDGIRNSPQMASICLICGSIHVVSKDGEPGMLVCRNCGFAWYRYECLACGKNIDGRDPQNPGCRGGSAPAGHVLAQHAAVNTLEKDFFGSGRDGHQFAACRKFHSICLIVAS
jgi:hypothetical protein